VLANPWVTFILRRVFSLIVILIALDFATFIMVRLIPGNPGLLVAGINATVAQVQQINHSLGVDQPIAQQFVTYTLQLLHGDLGTSFVDQEPVRQILAERTGPSLQLASVSLILVLGFSIPGGILAGAITREGHHKKIEIGFTGLTSVVGSLPEYLAATFLTYIFAIALHVLPVAGSDTWQALVLPTLAISLRPIAILMRVVRLETLNVLSQDYIRTARSKRLSVRLLYLRHALPNVIAAALTVGGVVFAGLIGGAVVVENVFARLGLGTALVGAVEARDYPVIQGVILVLGIVVVLANAMVDILLAVIDPRSITRQA
jgi:peptide/nickel transport system permease protein